MKNTTQLNSSSKDSENIGLWVFGYGSLIWRPGIAYSQSYTATVSNWARRLWQGSHDHRGTIESPGRVLTLVPTSGAQCEGRVFGVDKSDVNQVLAYLDVREQNGYERQYLTATTSEHGDVEALTYIAPMSNHAWLGDASDEAIAKQIAMSHGPSGSNKDYVLSLHKALIADGIHDEHIQAIARLLA